MVDLGRVTIQERDLMLKWCQENWGSHWGEVDTKFDFTYLIFHQLSHANWFMLKWA
jgi:hypothetical protein